MFAMGEKRLVLFRRFCSSGELSPNCTARFRAFSASSGSCVPGARVVVFAIRLPFGPLRIGPRNFAIFSGISSFSKTSIVVFSGFLGSFRTGGEARCRFLGEFAVFQGEFFPVGCECPCGVFRSLRAIDGSRFLLNKCCFWHIFPIPRPSARPSARKDLSIAFRRVGPSSAPTPLTTAHCPLATYLNMRTYPPGIGSA